MMNYQELPLKAKRISDELAKQGLTRLYDIVIDHRDSCGLVTGGECTCRPRVKKKEKFSGLSRLT
jgi:hypothetical protein